MKWHFSQLSTRFTFTHRSKTLSRLDKHPSKLCPHIENSSINTSMMLSMKSAKMGKSFHYSINLIQAIHFDHVAFRLRFLYINSLASPLVMVLGHAFDKLVRIGIWFIHQCATSSSVYS